MRFVNLSMKKHFYCTILFLFCLSNVSANSFFTTGKTFYQNRDFESAALYFEKSLLNHEEEGGSIIYLWLVQSLLAIGRYDIGIAYADSYIRTIGQTDDVSQMVYYKAVALYEQEKYVDAVRVFSLYLNYYDYPEHRHFKNDGNRLLYYPESYYWIASSLEALDKLSDAKQVLLLFVNHYQTHPLAIKARKKIDVIDLILMKRKAEDLLGQLDKTYTNGYWSEKNGQKIGDFGS